MSARRSTRQPIPLKSPRVEYEKLSGDRLGEPSAATRSGRPGGGGAGAVQQSWTPVGRRRGGSRAAACWPTPTSLHCRSGTGVGPALRAAGFVRRGRRGAGCPLGAAAGGDAAAPRWHPDERPGLLPQPEVGANDCRSFIAFRTGLAGSERIETVHPSHALRTSLAARFAALRGASQGDPVSAEKAALILCQI